MSITEAQQAVDNWINKHGVRYFNELTNMAILTEEVGEVARIISRKYGEQSFKEGDKNDLPIKPVLICKRNSQKTSNENHYDITTDTIKIKNFN